MAYNAAMSQSRTSRFEERIWSMMNAIKDVLHLELVENFNEKLSMDVLIKNGSCVKTILMPGVKLTVDFKRQIGRNH